MNQLNERDEARTLRERMKEHHERTSDDYLYEYMNKYKLKTYKMVKGCMRDLTTENIIKKLHTYETKRNIHDGFLDTKLERLEKLSNTLLYESS